MGPIALGHATQSGNPYLPGATLRLQFRGGGEQFEARVVKTFDFTLSCVLLVKAAGFSDPCVLKLYDRRFAAQWRANEDAGLWNLRLEQEYHELISKGDADSLFDDWSAKFREDHYWQDHERSEWTDAMIEAYLDFLCQRAFDSETHAYSLIRDMQGVLNPRLLAEVILEVSSSTCSKKEMRYPDCPGILLQYIDGFPLTELADRAPESTWQDICEQAVDIVRDAGRNGVCNKDVKTRSFIIGDDSKVFMIDFGLCVFRDQASSVEEFEEWQADQDEEGAVGLVMQQKLNGRFNFQPSEESEDRLRRFKSE